MKIALLICYKWETSSTIENPFSDIGAIALNGIRCGKARIVPNDYDFSELRDELIDEFERDNPGFNAKYSIMKFIDLDDLAFKKE